MSGRPEARLAKSIKVKVRGKDRNGNPFVQTTRTLNVSQRGACLDNIPCTPGEVIELGRWWKKARYRVVWIGSPGTPEAYHVGLSAMEPDKDFWGLDFSLAPQSEWSPPPEVAAPPPLVFEDEYAPTGPIADYEVLLRCPYGDEEHWEKLTGRRETLEQIQNIQWDMDCPTHGPQRLLPLRSRILESAPAVQAAPVLRAEPRRLGINTRSSTRVPRHVPLLVHGSTPDGKSFLEETSTLLINEKGGLVELTVHLRVGQTVEVVNRDSKFTEVCRVAYVGPEGSERCHVGIAFRRRAQHFWGA